MFRVIEGEEYKVKMMKKSYIKSFVLALAVSGLVGCTPAEKEMSPEPKISEEKVNAKEIQIEKQASTRLVDDKEKMEDNKVKKSDTREEKQVLFDEFTQTLIKTQGRQVKYQGFLDEDHFLYVTTDQIDSQLDKIIIAGVKDGEVVSRYEGGVSGDDTEAFKAIHHVYVNKLKHSENPNICIVRINGLSARIDIIEVVKETKVIQLVGSGKFNRETKVLTGDEQCIEVANFSEPGDYSIQ